MTRDPRESPGHQLARAIRLILWQTRDGSQSPVAHGFKDAELRKKLTALVRDALNEGGMTLFDVDPEANPNGDSQ